MNTQNEIKDERNRRWRREEAHKMAATLKTKATLKLGLKTDDATLKLELSRVSG